MRPWAAAALGGITASGVVLVFCMLRKKAEIEREGNVLRAQLTQRFTFGAYRAQMDRLRTELGAHAETVANRAADEHLASAYGLTRDRMQQMQALAQRLRVTG